MSRLVNRLPKYSLQKRSGQAKVWLNGKDTYLGKYGWPESKEASRRFIGSIPKPADPTKQPQPAAGAVLLVGDAVLQFNAPALTYYARDGVATGEHLTVRCALRPLTKRPPFSGGRFRPAITHIGIKP